MIDLSCFVNAQRKKKLEIWVCLIFFFVFNICLKSSRKISQTYLIAINPKVGI